jgi:hypothetical protein
MAGGNLPFGLAPSGDMTSYTPTLSERATDWIRRKLFSDDRAGQQKASRVMDVAQFTPFGFATDMYDAGRAGGRGDYATAGTMLAMAGLPGPTPSGLRGAAIKYKGKKYTGRTHEQAIANATEATGDYIHRDFVDQGFLDSRGRFLMRDDPQAALEALSAEQITDPVLRGIIENEIRNGSKFTSLIADAIKFSD